MGELGRGGVWHSRRLYTVWQRMDPCIFLCSIPYALNDPQPSGQYRHSNTKPDRSTQHHNPFVPKMARSSSGYTMLEEHCSNHLDAHNELTIFTRLHSSDATHFTPNTTTSTAQVPSISIRVQQERLFRDVSSTSAFSSCSAPPNHSPSDSVDSFLACHHTRPLLRRRSTTASEKANVKRIHQHMRADDAPDVRKAEASFMEKHQERDVRAWNRWGLLEAAKQSRR
jgi:hypothetical protein